MISWRNPDARHADWGLDTYVQAVLDALDAVEQITGDRPHSPGRRRARAASSPASPPAHLAATGRQDRLAAFTLLVTVLDNAQAGTSAALIDAVRRRRREARLAGAAATSTAGRWPRCSPGSAPAT